MNHGMNYRDCQTWRKTRILRIRIALALILTGIAAALTISVVLLVVSPDPIPCHGIVTGCFEVAK